MASQYEMKIDQGSDYKLLVTLNKDLTGRLLRGNIRTKTSQQNAEAVFSFTMVDFAIGKFYIELHGEISSLIKMPPQSGPDKISARMVYDIESYVNASDQDPIRELEGIVIISPEATK